jgi:hypothetical protein
LLPETQAYVGAAQVAASLLHQAKAAPRFNCDNSVHYVQMNNNKKKKTLNATAQKYLFCSCVNNQNTQKY